VRRILALPVIVVACGCIIPEPVPPQPVYAVRRSALVPHPAPPARTGFPLGGSLRLSLHDSTVLVPVEPREGDDADAGLYVARHSLGGALRFRLRACDLGLMLEASLIRGAMAIAGDNVRPPGRSVHTYGFTFACSVPITENLRLGATPELRIADIPHFEEGRCIYNCHLGSRYYTERQSRDIAIGSFSLLPSYRVGRLTLFAGITWVNHPTNLEASVQTPLDNQVDGDSEINGGTKYRILSAGVEWRLRPGAKLFVQLFQPLDSSVATYGPAAGIAIAVEPDLPTPASMGNEWDPYWTR
jgi:hypothetical protein